MKLLTNSPAEIIAYMMVDLGLGINPANYSDIGSLTQWPIFDSSEPDLPDNCITIFDTGGVDDGRAMVGGVLFIHPGIQVRVRSKDHPTGWTKADTVRATLAESAYQEVVTIGSVSYLVHALSRFSPVIKLGKELETEQARRVSKRDLFTINCLASIRQYPL